METLPCALRQRLLPFAVLALLPSAPAMAGPDDVIGEWQREDHARIQIYRCAEAVCGRIVKVPEGTGSDLNNPIARLRARPILGIQVLKSERRAAGNAWKVRLYEPDTGATHGARIETTSRDRLVVSQCGFLGLLCSTQTWTRTR